MRSLVHRNVSFLSFSACLSVAFAFHHTVYLHECLSLDFLSFILFFQSLALSMNFSLSLPVSLGLCEVISYTVNIINGPLTVSYTHLTLPTRRTV